MLHDPEFRRVRRRTWWSREARAPEESHPAAAKLLADLDGHQFRSIVVSAAPEEVIQSALEESCRQTTFRTRFRYDAETGEIQSIARVPGWYGKWRVVDELRAATGSATTASCTSVTAVRTCT